MSEGNFVNKQITTEELFKTAAIILCQMRGIDPDHSEPNFCSSEPIKKNWEVLASEIQQHVEVKAAIDMARLTLSQGGDS